MCIRDSYYNTTDQPITASVHIDVHTYKPEVTYTPAHAFVTFNNQINVAPGASGSVEGTCDVPPDAQFITMTTHSHQFTTSARVLDGASLVLETTDWEHA